MLVYMMKRSILDILTAYLGRQGLDIDRETICHSLGLTADREDIKPSHVVDFAKKAGVSAKFVKQDLARIHRLTLPALLILKDGSSCLLIEKDGVRLRSLFADDLCRDLSFEELEADYSGYCFFLGKEAEGRVEAAAGSQARQGWFFRAVKVSLPIYRDILLASFAINLFVLAVPMFSMNVYDRVVPNFATDTLWVLAIAVLMIICFDGLLKFLRVNFIELATRKSDILISSLLFDKVMDLRMEAGPANVGGFATNIKFASIAASFEGGVQKSALLIESIAGLKTIKLFNAAGRFRGRWEHLVSLLAGHGIKSRFLSSSINTVMGMLIQIDSVFIVIYGVYLIHDGELTMGGLIAVMILSSRAISPVGQVAGLLSSYDQTKVAYASLKRIMELPAELEDQQNFLQPKELSGDIEFKDVSFAYPDMEQPSVTGISFHIRRGEKVALLGANGSGKTTLHQLMVGFYKPQQGSILLEDLIAAIRLAGLEPLIEGCPQGLAMPISERGANLSGGQRQAIAIARAFIGSPTIALLDEPTNFMDGKSEQAFVARLRARVEGMTLIVSSHKNALLSLVDRVIVVDKGRLIFDDSKDAFIQKFYGAAKSATEGKGEQS